MHRMDRLGQTLPALLSEHETWHHMERATIRCSGRAHPTHLS